MGKAWQPRWLLFAAMLVAPELARAAGGSHVADDSEVETPGDCHFEAWLTSLSDDQWHTTGGVGCTPGAIPTLELGGSVSHSWAPGSDDTLAGVGAKLNLRPAASGLGVAVSGSLAYGLDRSRLEAAALTGVVTLPATDRLTINLNAGWGWTEAGPGSELFVGAQADWAVGSGFSLMAEGFTRDHGKAGGQAGLRWTSGNGRIDLDLLAARYGDGATPTALTAGMAVRW